MVVPAAHRIAIEFDREAAGGPEGDVAAGEFAGAHTWGYRAISGEGSYRASAAERGSDVHGDSTANRAIGHQFAAENTGDAGGESGVAVHGKRPISTLAQRVAGG